MQRIGNGSGPVYYQFDQWAGGSAVLHGVFTRLGGVSAAPWESLNVGSTVGDSLEAVAQNRQRMAAALGLDEAQTCTVWQVHGAETLVIDAPVPGVPWLAKADGMVTNHPDVALVMRFADCVPILFYDPVQGAIGLAHAGWRGTVAGAGPSVVRKMAEVYGSRPQDIQAAIGPSIGPEHYQVGEAVVAAFQQAFARADRFFHRAEDGSAYLNLWAANEHSLRALGLEQIEVAGLCTANRTDEFFSHRAERGRTGRFGLMMKLSV